MFFFLLEIPTVQDKKFWSLGVVSTANEGPVWESSINVWFPFMYSLKWNCYFLNRIIMFCLPVPTPICLWVWEIYIFPGSVCLLCCREICGPILEIYTVNRSQTHECGNWDWGRVIPRKGIHKWDFPCSVRNDLISPLLWNQQLPVKTIQF